MATQTIKLNIEQPQDITLCIIPEIIRSGSGGTGSSETATLIVTDSATESYNGASGASTQAGINVENVAINSEQYQLIADNTAAIENVASDWGNIDGNIENQTDLYDYISGEYGIEYQGAITKDPTGFENTTDSSISFDEATRTFTIAPSVASYDVRVLGKLYTLTGGSVTIDDLTALWFIYYNTLGVLSAGQYTHPGVATLIENAALIAVVYWDSATSTQLYLGDERHGWQMDSATHQYLHYTVGAVYSEGLGLSNLDIDGNGDDESAAQLGVNDGIFFDEDLLHHIINGSPQTLSTIAQIPIMYRTGLNSASLWAKDAATNYPVKTGATGRAYYNQLLNDVWVQTSVDNRDLMLIHLFATNDIYNPIVAVQGQAEYNNRGAARDGAATELLNLNTSGMVFAEFIPIATVIVETQDGYDNVVQSRFISTESGADYIDWRIQKGSSAGISAADHGNLAGLNDDDHLQYLLRTDSIIKAYTKYYESPYQIASTLYGIQIDQFYYDPSTMNPLNTLIMEGYVNSGTTDITLTDGANNVILEELSLTTPVEPDIVNIYTIQTQPAVAGMINIKVKTTGLFTIKSIQLT